MEVFIKDEFIKLGQALKLSGIAGSGVEAKLLIQEGKVRLNGDICTERGKKCHPGDIIFCLREEVKIVS